MSEEATSKEVVRLENATRALKTYCVIVLNSMSTQFGDLQQKTICNFVARGMTCLESVFLVWKFGSEQDAWILHRALVDRLFYLDHLIRHDLFEDFERHSFIEVFEEHQAFLDDQVVNHKASPEFVAKHESERARYQQLKGSRSKWKRPVAVKMAKAMKLDFLYPYAYQYASGHVHPMAEDGTEDFKRLTLIGSTSDTLSVMVVENSVHAQCLLVQTALRGSRMEWVPDIWKFPVELQVHVARPRSVAFQKTLDRLGKAWPAARLGRAQTPSTGSTKQQK